MGLSVKIACRDCRRLIMVTDCRHRPRRRRRIWLWCPRLVSTSRRPIANSLATTKFKNKKIKKNKKYLYRVFLKKKWSDGGFKKGKCGK